MAGEEHPGAALLTVRGRREGANRDQKRPPSRHPTTPEGEAMTTATLTRNNLLARTLDRLDIQALGGSVVRYGLVTVVGWIGLMKFTHYEAEGIRPFVANSPLMSWVYGLTSVGGFSAMLGVVEVAIAILIAARPFSSRATIPGSALAVGMFLTTLSFLLTT